MNYKKLGQLIEESPLRKADIISQSGVSKSTLDNVINGIDAKISTIEAISKVLGVSPAIFFEDERVNIRQAGRDYSEHGQINNYGSLDQCIKLYDNLLAEKDARIAEKTTYINELKAELKKFKGE